MRSDRLISDCRKHGYLYQAVGVPDGRHAWCKWKEDGGGGCRQVYKRHNQPCFRPPVFSQRSALAVWMSRRRHEHGPKSVFGQLSDDVKKGSGYAAEKEVCWRTRPITDKKPPAPGRRSFGEWRHCDKLTSPKNLSANSGLRPRISDRPREDEAIVFGLELLAGFAVMAATAVAVVLS